MTSGVLNPLRRIPPMVVLAAAIAFGLLSIVLVVVLALEQPWLGLKFAPSPDGKGIVVVSADGPGAEVPEGTVVTRIEGGGDAMELEALDLTVEPDGVIPDYDTYRRFIARQDALSKIQHSETVSLFTSEGAVFKVRPDLSGRPLSRIPPDFWVSLVVGLVAWTVSAAVSAFRPGDAGARYLLLSGLATLVFAPGAAIYTTRELAVDGTVFRWASDLNFFGGSVFIASFVALLLHYPRRLAPTWVGISVVALFVIWFVMQQLDVFESMIFARRALVMVGVAHTFVLAGVHWFRTGKDPVARAALQWFLLSWVLGTSLFALFILLPQMFGVDTSSVQGYAFLLFLLVYGGLAFGILRYRLFDLGKWWRRVAMWTLSVLLLILLDLVFLFGLKLSNKTSLGLALLICGVVWLPVRGWIWSRLTKRGEKRKGDVFGQVMDIALSTPGQGEQDSRWKELLQSVFDPLRISVAADAVRVTGISADGLGMDIPAVNGVTGLRLEYAGGGRKLFTPRDVELAQDLVTMLAHALESRSSYEKGVVEERGRIARDMHDNIGAQLLAALHTKDSVSKDSKIRETLADLREVINNPSAGPMPIEETLAELRVETADRLGAAGIALRWTSEAEEGATLCPAVTHALRSVVREAVSNVIRHSGAAQASVAVNLVPGLVTLEIHDDGRGFTGDATRSGNGLSNMRARMERLGGTLELEYTVSGTRLAARVPIPGRKEAPSP